MNKKHSHENYPLVSVIVPVKNGEKTIGMSLAALLKQNYPQDKMQVIIVDNGSQDNTIEIIKKYPVILEYENEIASSYAARNKGLSAAQGEIIAFTDADCIPEKNWIENGVRALNEQNSDMAGGKIEFIFSEQKSVAELFDSLNSLRNDNFINAKLGAVTANLFVRAGLFCKIGLFPEVRTGGDISWTGRALSKGSSLIYAPDAIVYHPARNFLETLKKSWLHGTGMLFVFSQRRWRFLKIIYLFIRLLIPVPAKVVLKSVIAFKSDPDIRNRHMAMWWLSYLNNLFLLGGLVYSIFRNNPDKNKSMKKN